MAKSPSSLRGTKGTKGATGMATNLAGAWCGTLDTSGGHFHGRVPGSLVTCYIGHSGVNVFRTLPSQSLETWAWKSKNQNTNQSIWRIIQILWSPEYTPTLPPKSQRWYKWHLEQLTSEAFALLQLISWGVSGQVESSGYIGVFPWWSLLTAHDRAIIHVSPVFTGSLL